MRTETMLKLPRGALALALLIVLIALALRAGLLVERAATGDRFWPEVGSDQYTYVEQARGLLAGTWPDAPYWYHPLPSYVYAAGLIITGGELVGLRLLLAALDALTAGALIGAALLLTRRVWAALIAGAAYALYPVSVFYGTTLLIAPLAAGLLALFCWLALWQHQRLSLWRSLLLGLVSGALLLGRLNLTPVVLAWPLLLILLRPGWRRFSVHMALWALSLALTLAPFTLWNAYASGGDFIPVATTGAKELYMANNRDASGQYGSNLALEQIDADYLPALMRDIQLDPLRFLGLMGRKFALFFSAAEPASNLDYAATRQHSALLSALPGDFVLVALLGMIGLVRLAHHDRRLAIFFGVLLLAFLLSNLLTFAQSRLRYPVVVPLLLLGGVTLVSVQNWLKAPRLPQRYALREGLALLLIAVLLLFPLWALAGDRPPLPPKRVTAALPADAIRLDVDYNGLTLVGWRPVALWPAAQQGWLDVNQAVTIELFWQITQPVTVDYQFGLAYLVDGERTAGVDRAIGAVSYPPTPTSTWEPGRIYSEVVSLRIPDGTPEARSGPLLLSVYRLEAGQIFSVPVSAPQPMPNLPLLTLAAYAPWRTSPPADLVPADITFGERIVLRGYSLNGRLTVYWEALTNLVTDYRLFLHVVGTNDQIITQADPAPVPGLETSNWRPGLPLVATLPIPMPDAAGRYRLMLGLYNPQTGERLSFPSADGAVQDRLIVGTLDIP